MGMVMGTGIAIGGEIARPATPVAADARLWAAYALSISSGDIAAGCCIGIASMIGDLQGSGGVGVWKSAPPWGG